MIRLSQEPIDIAALQAEFLAELDDAGGAVDERHAIEKNRGGKRTGEKVLEGRKRMKLDKEEKEILEF